MEKACRFCDIVKGHYKYSDIDRPFYENELFIAIASVGALVEGWTLVVPKIHQVSMRNLYSSQQLNDTMNFLIPRLANKYGKLIVFEHGSNKEGSITSCGTDHAHLHIVPYGESLLPDMKNTGMRWENYKTSEIDKIVNQSEYLFYHEIEQNQWEDPIGYLHILETPISQFFRKVIADRIGCLDRYDYKKFPNIEIAQATNKALLNVCTL
jgi:Diadenosine tetraphosphate (Ap4A) hydrolase and other HIT family hydrolases